jgi:hypothetical protein
MDVKAFIAHLQRRGFLLVPRGDKLSVAPAKELTPHLEALLRAYKQDILRFLRTGKDTKQQAMVVHHQDPEACPACGQNVWWISVQHSRGCLTCYPTVDPNFIIEFWKPLGAVVSQSVQPNAQPNAQKDDAGTS